MATVLKPTPPPPPLPPPHQYDSALGRLRHVLFGRALATSGGGHLKLPVLLALPIFSSDALSSNAYATEAILGVLLATVAATGTLHFALPIAVGISLLMLTVVLSYRQIIFAYPDGGGAYPVSRDNLGVLPSLIAGGSLLVDYVLTVAVSVAAGVAAIITAVPSLQPHIVPLCIAGILMLMLANLRGIKEAGWLFAGPAYLFIFSILATVVAGLFATFSSAPHVTEAARLGESYRATSSGLKAVGLYVVLQAFSQGCTALTGVEAISNTTPLFTEPRAKNAALTTAWMGGLAVTMFIGLTFLAVKFGIHTHLDSTRPDYRSVVGQVADLSWPPALHWMFYVVQAATAAVLVIAANAAFAGFPQLTSMLARDNFLPRQLANVGDRLAYSNGIILLSVFAIALVYIFHGIVNNLLNLYAIGVFTSFTIAQFGMVRRWLRTREKNWQSSLFLNALGATATGIVTLIIAVSKFDDGDVISPFFRFGPYHPHYGTWLVVVILPVMVWLFLKVNRHYTEMGRELALPDNHPAPPSRNVVLVPVPRLHRGVVSALNYARTLSGDVRAIYIETDPAGTKALKAEWTRYGEDIPLVIMESPYRSLIGPLTRYVDAVQRERTDDVVTIVLPELVSRKPWHRLLHNQYAPLLRLAFSNRRDVVLTNVRYFLEN